ncbi:MAG: 3'-5' exonuclease [Endomicrobium sp.]|jgi:DNA polymerase III epsilon subunit family exonuclease|nr:3'-5' exonuclease [Endomicrobium sp.]
MSKINISTKNFNNFVFLDTETTGIDKKSKIIEIAILKFIKNTKIKYESLINPGCKIPNKISKINNITNKMVENSPYFNDISKHIFMLIRHNVIICHNALFDLFFIKKELYQSGILLKQIYYIDTLAIARKYFNFESNKLIDIAQFLNIETKQTHRAMQDVLTTISIAKYMFANLYNTGIYSLKPSIYNKTVI